MKNKNLGSSETTREASITNTFGAYAAYCPRHRKLDPAFLEWFLGFLEGHGCFLFWHDGPRLKFAIRITQSDQALLHNIRTQLGFGRVGQISANQGKVYAQLTFETRESILALLHLCAGNLRLTKTQARFSTWAEKVCQRFNIEMPVNPKGFANQPISLETAWLSGFFQADGGFNAQYRTDTRLRRGYRVTLRAYLDQKGESEILTEISRLVGGFISCRNQDVSYFRLTIGTEFQPLVDYLAKFPLRGRKKIAQSRWIRLVNYLANYDLPEPESKSHARFLRLVRNVNACQHKNSNFADYSDGVDLF